MCVCVRDVCVNKALNKLSHDNLAAKTMNQLLGEHTYTHT